MKTLASIVGLNLVIVCFLKYGASSQVKIDVRQALFTEIVSNTQIFCDSVVLTPNFLHFKQEHLGEFLREQKGDSSIMSMLGEDTSRLQEERVQSIIMRYSKNGGDGCGSRSSDLAKNILWVSEGSGHGCCSDHSQVFLALCAINKIQAREVHHKLHTFNEYYDTDLQKWVWVDTQFALMAKGRDGQYLSFLQLSESIVDSASINWVFFGKSCHNLSDLNPYRANEYFRPPAFSHLMMTMGNNVFEQNTYSKKLAFLPTELRSLILISLGVQPKYIAYCTDDSLEQFYFKVKVCFLLSILVILLANFAVWYLLQRHIS
jgi:hypothetical protein